MGVFNPRKGAYRWISIDAVPVFRPGEEEPYEVYTVFADITERRRTEEALRASEATLRGILDATNESIWLFSAAGVALAGNQTALARWGRPAETIIGKTISEVLPPELASLRLARLQEVTRTGRHVEFEDTRDGIRFEHTFYPVTNADGRVDRIAIFSRDVTERRRAEAVLRRYQLLARHSRDIVLFIRREDGRILEGNAAAESAYGYGREELLALSIRALRAPGTLPLTEEQMAVADARGLLFETIHRRKDGSTFPVEVSSQGTTIDGSRTLVSVVRDISERKRTEQELQQANLQLAEADQRKNEFLAILSHELRNPLTPIRNGLVVLERAVPGSEQAKRAQEVIDRQSAQLARLVDDLLDVTRVSRNKIRLQLEPLEFNVLVQRTVEDFRSHFDGKGVALEVDLAPGRLPVHGDSARLAQIVGNLLQNAAKFTQPGGRVEVRTTPVPSRGRVALRVTDTGAGIEEEMLRRLFLPFMQADKTLDRSKGGLGLGLALVKGLVEQHGGEVRAHSDGPGKGSEFVVELPLDESGAAAASEAPAGRAQGPNRRVLIIEDNMDAADSLREVLEFAGHVVEVAYNGPDGLAKARVFQPEIVLCDIELPGMDGYEVARAFAADAALAGCFLVALSGYALQEDLQRVREAGFAKHLAKPPNFEALADLLACAPRRSRDAPAPAQA